MKYVNMIFLLPFLFYFIPVLFVVGCKEIKVLTAKDYTPKLETAQSVEDFARANNIDGFPILRYDPSFDYNLPSFSLQHGLFNHQGNYISLTDGDISCKLDDYHYLVLKDILLHGDSMLRREFIEESYLSYSIDSIALLSLDYKEHKAVWDSLFLLYGKTQIVKMDLDQYAEHLIALNGNKVELKSLFTHYVILQEFYTSGKAGLFAVRIRELIRDIKKLNKEFNNQIQLILIYNDGQATID